MFALPWHQIISILWLVALLILLVINWRRTPPTEGKTWCMWLMWFCLWYFVAAGSLRGG